MNDMPDKDLVDRLLGERDLIDMEHPVMSQHPQSVLVQEAAEEIKRLRQREKDLLQLCEHRAGTIAMLADERDRLRAKLTEKIAEANRLLDWHT